MFDNTDIIITTNIIKKELLNEFSKSLTNIKIYTLSEFSKSFYYDYDDEAILYIMDKYNVIYEIAKIYISNLTYITNQTYTSEKLNFLKELKEDLLKKKLIKVNKLFISSLKDKNIIIYNLGTTKEITRLQKDLVDSNVTIVNNDESKYSNHSIYELNTIEDEVVFIANDICQKIEEGIDIKNLYLTNLNDEYYKIIRMIFPMFNIPFTLKDNGSIYGTFLSTKFIELYNNDINKTMEELKEFIDSNDTEEVYNQILDIVNKYAFINNYLDVLPLIIEDLKTTKLKRTDVINSVHETTIDNKFGEEDYVYLLSFNQGIIPHIHKDEQYLSDNDKKELGISLTIDMNKKEREDVIRYLSNIKNLTITYKLSSNGNKFNISNINEVLQYPIINDITPSYNYSNLYNMIKLTSLKDEYNKYGTTSDSLYALNSTYPKLSYKKYNHVYKKINKEDLKEFLNNNLNLSYTKIDNYYKCPFSYYLTHVLKLNVYEETFNIKIGNIFHAVLERFNDYQGTYDELWNETINDIEFDNKEKFFLDKLHDELLFVCNTIKEQENYTELHDELHEEEVIISLSGDMKITFKGFIDKIKYKEEDNKTIIAIIDYKTGTPVLDLKTIPYGIGMQLPVYIYLAKNTNKINNIEIAGFYLQHILNNEQLIDINDSYEEIKKEELKLQGYSNDNISILSKWDNTYEDSKLIKGMKVKKDGDFYANTKVLSAEQIDYLSAIAEKKINEAVELISNAEFSIAPKKIDKINYGCKYCKYRDICFYKPDDIEELKPLTKEEVFGGDK